MFGFVVVLLRRLVATVLMWRMICRRCNALPVWGDSNMISQIYHIMGFIMIYYVNVDFVSFLWFCIFDI